MERGHHRHTNTLAHHSPALVGMCVGEGEGGREEMERGGGGHGVMDM